MDIPRLAILCVQSAARNRIPWDTPMDQGGKLSAPLREFVRRNLHVRCGSLPFEKLIADPLREPSVFYQPEVSFSTGSAYNFKQHTRTTTSLANPLGICVDNRNRVLVCDKMGQRIQVISEMGEHLFVFGDGIVKEPRDVAVGPRGYIYVTCRKTSALHIFSPDGKHLLQFGSYSHPEAVDVDGLGRIALTEENRIVVYVYLPYEHNATTLTLLHQLPKGETKVNQGICRGLAFDPDGYLHSMSKNMLVFDIDSGKIVREYALDVGAGNMAFFCFDNLGRSVMVHHLGSKLYFFDKKGKVSGSLEVGRTTTKMNYGYGVAIDRRGRLFATDWGHHRVLMWD